MRIILNMILFFSFFSSIALFNIESVSWGLQLSWGLGIFYLIIYVLLFINKNPTVEITKKFKYYVLFMTWSIVFTIVSLVCLKFSIISISNTDLDVNELIRRSLIHTIYLIFNFLVSTYIYFYIQKFQNFNDVVKYFIFYPSIIIMLIGLYGFLATYDIVPKDSLFHNNLSLGYTFERFKAEHRTASVFAEPSHYSIYLAFLLPIYYTYFKKKIRIFSFKYRYIIILLYISQIIMVKSMSFVVVLPFLIIFTYFYINSLKLGIRDILYLFLVFVILGPLIYFIMNERIINLISGEDGSAILRFSALLDSLSLFMDSPFIGVGYGAIRGIDSFSTLLATIGLLGFFVFIYFLININKNLILIQKVIYAGLICLLMISMLADSMLDYLYIWIMVAIITVNKKIIKEKRYE